MPQEQPTTAPAPVTQPVATPDVSTPITPQAPPAAPNPRIDQYDLGDTGIFVDTGSSPPPIDPPPPVLPPRGPDGKFTKAEPPPAPTPVPKHSEYSILQAKDLGFSDAEIEAATPEQLQREVYLVSRRLFKERQQDAKIAAHDPPRPDPDSSGVPHGTPAPEPSFDWGEGPEYGDDGAPTGKTTKYTEDMVARPIVNVLKRQDKIIAELKAQVQQLLGHEQTRQKEAFFSEVDKLFVSKPDIFGDKAGSQMKADDPLFQKRGAIVMLMNSMKSGSMKERWDRAVKMVYGDAKPSAPPPPAPEPPPSTPRITPDQWAQSALPRPTHRNGATEPAGVDRAAKNMEAKLREFESTDDEAADKDFRP